MKAAIVGAGFSGIVAARTLRAFGIDVTVFDRTPDIGGVWSATRGYPGISTQNDKSTYAFSDLPMPDHFPENPSGEQVRTYLEAYVRQHDLGPLLRLGTSVERAEPDANGRWHVTTDDEAGRTVTQVFDAVVIATGLFSEPYVPVWPGLEVYLEAGGRILTPSDVHDDGVTAGRSVAVVGWGKSACDVAVAVADSAASTTVIARSMRWKVPRFLGRITLYRRLLLSRAGQHLLWHTSNSRFGRATYRLQRIPRGAVMLVLERLIARDQGLRALGLMPDGHLPNTISQPTIGLHERVADGRIRVRRGLAIASLGVDADGVPAVVLTDGSEAPAQVVIAATGYDQQLDLLDPGVLDRLRDEKGTVRLHRGIAALGVPGLMFAGFAASMFSPLSAEVCALWIAAALSGRLVLPDTIEQRAIGIPFELTHARAEREGGLPQVPGQAIADLDALLADLGYRLPWTVRVGQWFRVLDPRDYRRAQDHVLRVRRASASDEG